MNIFIRAICIIIEVYYRYFLIKLLNATVFNYYLVHESYTVRKNLINGTQNK